MKIKCANCFDFIDIETCVELPVCLHNVCRSCAVVLAAHHKCLCMLERELNDVDETPGIICPKCHAMNLFRDALKSPANALREESELGGLQAKKTAMLNELDALKTAITLEHQDQNESLNTLLHRVDSIYDQATAALIEEKTRVVGMIHGAFRRAVEQIERLAALEQFALDDIANTRKSIGNASDMDELESIASYVRDFGIVRDQLHEQSTILGIVDHSDEMKRCPLVEVLPRRAMERFLWDPTALVLSKARVSNVPTGFTELNDGGAVFVSRLNMVVCTSWEELDCGRTLQICRLTGECSRMHKLIPFKTTSQPVYDGEDRIYFFQRFDSRQRCGYVDVNTWEFIELPRVIGKFGLSFRGFVRGDSVYAVGSDARIKRFSLAEQTWETLYPVSGQYTKLFVHPWDDNTLIEMTQCGRVQERDIETGHITKTFERAYTDYHCASEAFVLPIFGGQYLLLACAGYTNSEWSVFNSASGLWFATSWPSTNFNSAHMWWHERERRLYYIVRGHKRWQSVG